MVVGELLVAKSRSELTGPGWGSLQRPKSQAICMAAKPADLGATESVKVNLGDAGSLVDKVSGLAPGSTQFSP